MDNEECEAELATGKTQAFVNAIFHRDNSKHCHCSTRTYKSTPAQALTRPQTIVWADPFSQLQQPRCTRRSLSECWCAGDLRSVPVKEVSGIARYEEVWERSQQTVNSAVRAFWKALVGRAKGRPATASGGHLLITEGRSLPRTHSPSVLRTRRSIARHSDLQHTASTPILIRKPVLSNISLYLTPQDCTPVNRVKSARKRQLRGSGSTPQSWAFPVWQARGFPLCDFRRLADSPAGLRSQGSMGALPKAVLKPIGKRGGKGKSRLKLGLRLKATPYQ